MSVKQKKQPVTLCRIEDSSEHAVSDTEAGRIIRLLDPFISEDRKKKMNEALLHRTGRITMVLDNLYDPHNGAAVLRSCDAFGVSSVHIIENRNPFRASRRVTQGAHEWLLLHRYADIGTCTKRMKRDGFRIVVFDHRGDTGPDEISDILRHHPVALCFGNEHEGISQELAESADYTACIPMQGFVSCLNVSVSAAVVLSRLRDGMGGDLNDSEKLQLKAQWYMRCVKGSKNIIMRDTENFT